MKYLVKCNSQPNGCSDCGEFDNYGDAMVVYVKHKDLGHDVSLVSIASLHEEETNYAPFRIREVSKTKSRITDDMIYELEEEIEDESSVVDFNSYFNKLVTLIPSEAVGVYLALYAIGKGSAATYPENDQWPFWISIICLVLVFVSRIFGTKKTGYSTISHFATTQKVGVIVASISFIIWLYAMGHEFAGIEIKQQRIIQGAVIIWTFVVPFVYKGDKD